MELFTIGLRSANLGDQQTPLSEGPDRIPPALCLSMTALPVAGLRQSALALEKLTYYMRIAGNCQSL